MSEKKESTISLEGKKKKGVKINTDDLQTNLTGRWIMRYRWVNLEVNME